MTATTETVKPPRGGSGVEKAGEEPGHHRAEAILLAERERCARLIENTALELTGKHHHNRHAFARYNLDALRKKLAEAVRKGK